MFGTIEKGPRRVVRLGSKAPGLRGLDPKCPSLRSSSRISGLRSRHARVQGCSAAGAGAAAKSHRSLRSRAGELSHPWCKGAGEEKRRGKEAPEASIMGCGSTILSSKMPQWMLECTRSSAQPIKPGAGSSSGAHTIAQKGDLET